MGLVKPEEDNSRTTHVNIVRLLSPPSPNPTNINSNSPLAAPFIQWHRDGITIANRYSLRLSNIPKNLGRLGVVVLSIGKANANSNGCTQSPDYVPLKLQFCVVGTTDYLTIDLEPNNPKLQPLIQALNKAVNNWQGAKFCNITAVVDGSCFSNDVSNILIQSWTKEGGVVAELSSGCSLSWNSTIPMDIFNCLQDMISDALPSPYITKFPPFTVAPAPSTATLTTVPPFSSVIPTNNIDTLWPPRTTIKPNSAFERTLLWWLILLPVAAVVILLIAIIYKKFANRSVIANAEQQALLPLQGAIAAPGSIAFFSPLAQQQKVDNRSKREILDELGINPAQDQILQHYICPFTSYITDDPMRLKYKINGKSYEKFCDRAAGEVKVSLGLPFIDPITGSPMTDVQISECPSNNIKGIIERRISEIIAVRAQPSLAIN